MSRPFQNKLTTLINLGLTEELPSINAVRGRIINTINYLILFGAFLLLIYRICFFDLVATVVNGTLIGLMLLNIFYCKNEKHERAIKLTSIYLVLLSIKLCDSELYISGIIYLSVLPIAFSLMHAASLLKHLYCALCVIIFTYFAYQLNFHGTILFTYYIVTFGIYIVSFSFFSFVERKQKELEKAIVTLENKNSELKHYNHITSHDLQEPLGTIRNFSHILSSRYSQSLDEIGKTSLQHIQNASNRMSALIKGLLDYSLIGNSGISKPLIISTLSKRKKIK